jgi:hypothetical protein
VSLSLTGSGKSLSGRHPATDGPVEPRRNSSPTGPPRYRYGCGILFPLGVRYSGGDPVEPEEVEGIRIANEIDPANGSAGADDGQEQGAEPASDGTTVEPEPEVNATVQPGTKQLE